MSLPVNSRQGASTNSRRDLLTRLEVAPEYQVEALLTIYELTQQIENEGLMELARDLLAARGTVLSKIASVLKTPEAVISIRATLRIKSLIRMINLDELLEVLSRVKPGSTSLVYCAREIMGEDFRRGLAASIGLLKILGAAIWKQEKMGKSRYAAANDSEYHSYRAASDTAGQSVTK